MKIVFTLDDLIKIGLFLIAGVFFLGLIITAAIGSIGEKLQRKVNKVEDSQED